MGEKERKSLLLDPSYLMEEHIKRMEIQQKSEKMKDFIQRFIDDKENKFRYDEYSKWKNLYKTLIDQNEELRQAQNNKECMVLNTKQNEYEQKISCLNQEIRRREKEMNEMKNKCNDIQNDYFSLESK